MVSSQRGILSIITAVSLAGLVHAQNQTVQTYPLSGQVRYLDGQWEGIKYASDGNVYFASSSQSAHHGASFFKYSPATQQVTMLAEDITAVVGEDPQTNPQGKIHANIQEMHGWLFFTTHFGADDRPGGITGWTGGHLVGYRLSDTGSNNYFGTPVGSFHDYGVMYPGYDAYSGIAVDPAQNYIYVFATGIQGGQVSYVFRYNAATDTQATRVNLGQVYGTFGASLYWFVDATGDVWFAIYNDNGALHRIHHDTQVIDRYDNVLPQFVRQDSNTPDTSDRAVQWMAPISGTKAVFTYNQGGMLYQFDSSLATASSVPASAFTALKWIGPSYIGSAVGNNRVFWYQRAGGAVGHQGCDAADTTLPPTCQDYHLMSVSLDSSSGYAITDHGLLIDQLGRTVWRTPAMTTDGTNQNVYLAGDWWTYDTSGNPIPGDHGVNNTLRYHYDGASESYIDEPRGEFFAVAHTSATPGSVSVTPPAVTLGQNQTQQFTATIQNQADQTVTWSLSPAVGTVSAAGLYQAPAAISTGQTVLVKATNASNASLFASASVTLQPPSGGSAIAQFVKADTTTQGSWKSAYGGDGYNVLGDAPAYPAYASVTPSGNLFWVWTQSTADVRGLQKSVAADRVAATWYTPGTFALDVNLTDGNPHQVAIYAVDWDQASRGQSVTVRDAASGVMLDGRTLSGFGNGVYLVWTITGHVTIQISCTAGVNAVISGIFFGTASAGPSPPSISLQPQGTTVTAGQTANFSVTASGTGLSYQWQSQAPGGSSFANISGATQNSYTTPAAQVSDSGTQFRVVVTNTGGPVTSNAATLTVQPAGGGGGGPAAFVTSKVVNGIRNDYDGFVGMAIHVGATPIAASAVGRIVAPGNSHTHLVKIVDGSTGADVPGGSALVVTAGGTAGSFAYTSLANPITLNAGSTYFVLSQENAGLDAWYDYNGTTIQTTTDAAAISAVYSSGASFFAIGAPGQTYGPVDFKYSQGAAPPVPPVITQQPVNATITAGQTAVFSVTATGTALTYQWQSQAPGGSSFANIPGATQSTYTTPILQVADSGTQFRCVVSNAGDPLNSSAATVTVQAPAAPVITQQPANATVTDGQTAGFSVAVTGTSLTYQWQVQAPGSSFTNIPGATQSIYSTPATQLSDSGTQFRCVINSAGGPITSGAATLTVLAPPAPVITQQPVDASATAGQTAGFSVTATGTGLSYQWQSQASGGSNFVNIPGATQSAYTTPATKVSDSGTQFRCVITNLGGSVTSNAVTLTVQPAGPAGFVLSKAFGTPRNDYTGWVGMAIHVGSNPLIVSSLGRIVTPGSTGSHLVKIVDGASGVDLPGASVSVATAGGTAGNFAYASLSTPIGLNAGTTYYILSQETAGGDRWDDYNNTIVQTTNDATVTSAVYNTGASYFVIGSTGQTYGPVDFRYIVSSGSLPPAAPLITQNPPNATLLAGQTATFSVTAASTTTLSYQWQSQAPGGSFTNIPGANSSSYTTPATQSSDNGTQYRCVVTNAGGSVNSSAATLSVLSGSTAFITGSSPGAARNDFDGWVGMIMTVGADPLVVSSMGRVCVAGNSGTHIVKFVDANSGVDIAGASVSVNMAGCTPGQYVYSALSNLITLQPGVTYYLVNNEGYGGDNWQDWGPVTYTSAATVNDSVYSPNSSYWKPIHKASNSYGPPNFQYSIGSPVTPPPTPGDPFVTAANLNLQPVRHDFTGWVGMKLTVGSYPVTVSEVGRLWVPGNSGTHTVKFVQASDGTDVPGGSASVIMAGGSSGQFSYTALANPITLQPNTVYYLVSQELIGGDYWYDYNLISTTTAAIVNSAVYWDGAAWIPVGAGTVSYVPPNFK